MKISKKTFGILSNGKKVHLYTLSAGDLKLSLSSFGAAWTSLMLPSYKNAAGSKNRDDVLLGFSDFSGYINNGPFLGVTVGRVANRISGAGFSLNGQDYRLDDNDNGNTLHSGRRGFDKLLWKADAYEENGGVYVRFELDSPAGDGGFPGNLKAAVTYGLSASNEIIAVYEAQSDIPTPVNFTNHAYFNLAGENAGSIAGHELCLFSSSYVEVNANLIPTGRLIPVHGSAFDFNSRKPFFRDRSEGYDHCFSVDGDHGKLRSCAEVFEPLSRRTMKLFCTQPGVQFYTGNMLPGLPGKAGSVYAKHTGFCLETQHFPDSPNQAAFPSCIFGSDRNYHEQAVFTFEIG